MKIKSLVFLFLIVAVFGCNKIKDATTLKIDTQLKTNIPLTVTSVGMNEGGLLKTAALPFSITSDLLLADNIDLSAYTSKIKEINLSNVVITVTGLTGNQTINSISLDIAGIGNVLTQTNITATNNTFTPQITPTLLAAIAAKFQADKKISITISGSVSAPLSCTVSVSLTSEVVVYTIS